MDHRHQNEAQFRLPLASLSLRLNEFLRALERYNLFIHTHFAGGELGTTYATPTNSLDEVPFALFSESSAIRFHVASLAN